MSSENSKRASDTAVDDVGRLGAVVKSALAGTGLTSETAAKYSSFCMEVYRYILRHPKTMAALKGAKDFHDVFDGSRKAFKAAAYIERGVAVGTTSAKAGFTAYGASGG